MKEIDGLIELFVVDGEQKRKKHPVVLYKALVQICSVIRGCSQVDEPAEPGLLHHQQPQDDHVTLLERYVNVDVGVTLCIARLRFVMYVEIVKLDDVYHAL